MATLNIKKMPESLHRRLKRRAVREHRSVSQEVVHILTQALEQPKSLCLLDLKGLGKGVWKDVDAGEHVEQERRSWD